MTQIGNTTRNSTSHKAYFYTILIVYTVLFVLFFSNLIGGAYKFFISNGYVYFVLIASDFVSNKLLFMITLIVSQVNRTQKIQFINRISGIDTIIFRRFGRTIDNSHLKISIFPVIVMWLFIILFSVSGLITLSKHVVLDNYTIKIAPIILYLEYTVYMLISVGYVMCVSLLNIRFRALKSIINEMQSKIFTARSTNVELLLFIYKELTSLVELINDFLGLLIFLRIVHDSVLGSFSTYVMLGMLLDRRSSWTSLVRTGLYLMHNISKMFMVILSADLCMKEVRIHFF